MTAVGTLPIRPIEIGALEQFFRDSFDRMLAAVGLEGAETAVTENQAWHPMDHTEPPYCPYVDSSVRSAAGASARLELRYERSHWNDDEIAQASVSVFAQNERGYAMISAHTSDCAIPVTELSIVGELPTSIAALVAELDEEVS